MFSVKHNRNGFAAFEKIPAVPCPFVMNGKEQHARFQPSLARHAVLECFEIFVAVLFCRGVAVGNPAATGSLVASADAATRRVSRMNEKINTPREKLTVQSFCLALLTDAL